ncbi:cuticle protein 16.8-like [Rhipicephalus sanguineus]|uniref:cuticle protein 16.8-like n=1 Tax=Rhipicephalus sanguineus TaxID=34632 RepID=UPI001894A634|nr:cuticle protein 16.8-like [Rhipicephalus sanguineus]
MFPVVQVLIVYLVVECHALEHHQPNQAGYVGAGYTGYTDSAAAASYGGYDAYASPPQPYTFGYNNVDEYGNRQFHSEQGDSNNAKTGSYGYRDSNGLYRRVNYVADAYGFRASVDTNEPGTAPGASADAVFNASPVVPPVPSSAVESRAPAAYGTQGPAPYFPGGYGGYGGYGYNSYVGAAGAYGYAPYGRYGGVASGAELGRFPRGGQPPYGYAAAGYGAGYRPDVNGAPVGYGSWPSAHHGFRRR